MPLTRPSPMGLALTLPLLALSGAPTLAQDGLRHYTLATANEGGTYYPVGVAIALLIKVNLESQNGIDMEAVVSGGSVDNLELLADGTAEFAILQALSTEAAPEEGEATDTDTTATDTTDTDTTATNTTDSGSADQGGLQQVSNWDDDVRAVTMLWPDVAHFLLRADLVAEGSLADLANLTGLGFSMGPQGSSTEQINTAMFEALDLPYQDWTLVHETYDDTVQSLPDGRIAGVNVNSGLGVGSVSQLLTAMGEGLALLTVTDDEAAQIAEAVGGATTISIPGGTYPGVEDARQSIAFPNFLAVSADVPTEDVYEITRTLFENLDYLCSVHQATCALSLGMAQAGLPVDLHPGAAQYFDEIATAEPDEDLAQVEN